MSLKPSAQVQTNVLDDNMRVMRENMRNMLLSDEKKHNELGNF